MNMYCILVYSFVEMKILKWLFQIYIQYLYIRMNIIRIVKECQYYDYDYKLILETTLKIRTTKRHMNEK
jgi:hypothetical protein